jgi:hypothetical protein
MDNANARVAKRSVKAAIWLTPNKLFVRFALYLIAGVTLFFSSFAHALQSGPCGKGDCVISVTQLSPNVERVVISRPVVSQAVFDYKSIIFRSGDEVLIDAEGCVQTGGAGRTWKRYVNPRGADANRFYFGSMEIAGVLTNMRFSDLLGQTLTVPAITPTTLVLRYTDDDYGDNGYYSHDDGIGNQCAGPAGAAAQVTLTITHAITPPTLPPPPPCVPYWDAPLPWDLAPAFAPPEGTNDDNCLPLNPRWSWQHPGVKKPPGFSPELVSQRITQVNSLSCASKEPDRQGHANWAGSTYTGKLQWDGHDRPYPFGDDDYNVKLLRPPIPDTNFVAGGTSANPASIKGEFDSDETIDHFDKSSWWRRFHEAVDRDGYNTRGPSTRGGRLIDGHDVVMTGLMSLDIFHADNASEIHPVNALAVRIEEVPNLDDDAWAIFARNLGNQGYCGADEPESILRSGTMRVRIPRPPGLPSSATATVNLTTSKFFKYNAPNLGKPSDWDVQSIPGGDAVITFFLHTPDQVSFMFGELHLIWSSRVVESLPGEQKPQEQTLAVSAQGANGPSRDEIETDGPEESKEERELYAALGPTERSEIERMIDDGLPPLQLNIEDARGATSIGPSVPPPQVQAYIPVPHERNKTKRDVSYDALCTVTGGVTAQVPGLCKATTNVRGDLNGDRVVDRDDLKILRGSLYRPVDQSACGAQCDVDGNGKITVHDAVTLVRLCTEPLCRRKGD